MSRKIVIEYNPRKEELRDVWRDVEESFLKEDLTQWVSLLQRLPYDNHNALRSHMPDYNQRLSLYVELRSAVTEVFAKFYRDYDEYLDNEAKYNRGPRAVLQ